MLNKKRTTVDFHLDFRVVRILQALDVLWLLELNVYHRLLRALEQQLGPRGRYRTGTNLRLSLRLARGERDETYVRGQLLGRGGRRAGAGARGAGLGPPQERHGVHETPSQHYSRHRWNKPRSEHHYGHVKQKFTFKIKFKRQELGLWTRRWLISCFFLILCQS